LRRFPSRLASDKALGIAHRAEASSERRGNVNSTDHAGERKASSCATSGCSRLSWNGEAGETCCRTCPRHGGRQHGAECERKWLQVDVQRAGDADNGQSRTRYYVGKGKAGMHRAETVAEVSSSYAGKGKAEVSRSETTSEGCNGSGYVGKGKADLHRAATLADGRNGSGYVGKGKVWGQSNNAFANEALTETVALPEQAVAILRTNREKASSFSEDLRLFANRFPFVAEYNGSSQVVLRRTASVHAEERARARKELGCLIDHYFPVYQEPRFRNAHLRVSEDRGACITMLHDGDGYLVDVVEDYPGQEFWSGEVIVEINGIPLGGLVEEEMEEVFGNQFADGASLVILTRGDDVA